MTDKDLEKLCHCLQRAPQEELEMLDFAGVLPGVRITGLPQHCAIDTIHGFLKRISSLDERLKLVAWLYCWLIPHDRLHGWLLYRLHPGFESMVYTFELHTRIAEAFYWSGMTSAFVPLACSHGRYACVVTSDLENGPQEHTVTCMSAWLDFPYLAVRSGGVINEAKFMRTLNNVVEGSLDALLLGTYEELSSGIAAALHDFTARCGSSQVPLVRFPETFGRDI